MTTVHADLGSRPLTVPEPVVQLRDLTIRYAPSARSATGRTAAENVSLTVNRGEVIGFVGKSGCGKTSVLNAIAGLLPGAFTGDIDFQGVEPGSGLKGMGYMLARDALLPWRSARRNVELPLEGLMPRSQRRKRAMALLEQLGLASSAGHFPHQLSQGMRQRVALARTLATDPQLILADEPFAALDAQTKLQVQDEFIKEWEEDQRTVLFVTHDLQEAILLADRVIVMAGQPGRIVENRVVDIPRPRHGKLVDLLTSDEVREHSLSLFHLLEEEQAPA